MKVLIILLAFLIFPTSIQAKGEVPTLTEEETLDTTLFMPPPPAFDSYLMANDRAKYEEGLTLRSTPRGMQATRDAVLKNFPQLFSEAFGRDISQENTPELYKLLQYSFYYVDKYPTRPAKKKYMRVRPFMFYNTNTCYQPDEEALRKNGSYPSGHSSTAWGYALILAEVNPAKKDAIFKRGYEMGQSRVICGYHWQSDVDAARIGVSAAIAILHSNPQFLELMQKAKEEFANTK